MLIKKLKLYERDLNVAKKQNKKTRKCTLIVFRPCLSLIRTKKPCLRFLRWKEEEKKKGLKNTIKINKKRERERQEYIND